MFANNTDFGEVLSRAKTSLHRRSAAVRLRIPEHSPRDVVHLDRRLSLGSKARVALRAVVPAEPTDDLSLQSRDVNEPNDPSRALINFCSNWAIFYRNVLKFQDFCSIKSSSCPSHECSLETPSVSAHLLEQLRGEARARSGDGDAACV